MALTMSDYDEAEGRRDAAKHGASAMERAWITELDATRAALAKCERALAAAQAEYVEARSFADFGSWAFEYFWHDGEPGYIEAGDAQEKAVELGLIGRTSDVDPAATHAEECDCSPEAPAAECCCYVPTRKPLAIARPVGSVEALRERLVLAWEAGYLRGCGGCNPTDGPPWDEDDCRNRDAAIARLLEPRSDTPEADKKGAGE